MLPLHVSVLLFYIHQTVLFLNVCPIEAHAACGLWRCVCSLAVCAVPELVCSTASCAALGRVRSTAVCAVPGRVCMLIILYSSLYARRCLPCSSLCFTWKYLFNSSLFCARMFIAYSSLCFTWTVSLHKHVLHLDVSVYWRF
jgi:hypothetical protein